MTFVVDYNLIGKSFCFVGDIRLKAEWSDCYGVALQKRDTPVLS